MGDDDDDDDDDDAATPRFGCRSAPTSDAAISATKSATSSTAQIVTIGRNVDAVRRCSS